LGDQIEKNELGGGGHIACIGAKRGANKVLMGTPEEKRPLGIPRRR